MLFTSAPCRWSLSQNYLGVKLCSQCTCAMEIAVTYIVMLQINSDSSEGAQILHSFKAGALCTKQSKLSAKHRSCRFVSLLQISLTYLWAKKKKGGGGSVMNITLTLLNPLCAFVSTSAPVSKAKIIQSGFVYFKAACKNIRRLFKAWASSLRENEWQRVRGKHLLWKVNWVFEERNGFGF